MISITSTQRPPVYRGGREIYATSAIVPAVKSGTLQKTESPYFQEILNGLRFIQEINFVTFICGEDGRLKICVTFHEDVTKYPHSRVRLALDKVLEEIPMRICAKVSTKRSPLAFGS